MVIIVGSVAGGAILAMELAKSNVPVTIIEKGKYIDSKDAFNYYDKYNGSVDLLTATCVGGSTMVSMANMVRALDEELYDYGINLSEEYDHVENLIKVHGLDDTHIGKGTQLFLDAAEELGLNPIKMPKAIYEEKCIQCGQCAFGCPVDAKWTGKHFVDIAIENGAEFIDEAEITGLIIEDNRIKGVKFIKNGKEEILHSDTVVLSAGAIGSALILRKIGIDAGRELFFDPFVSVGGVIKDIMMVIPAQRKNTLLVAVMRWLRRLWSMVAWRTKLRLIIPLQHTAP